MYYGTFLFASRKILIMLNLNPESCHVMSQSTKRGRSLAIVRYGMVHIALPTKMPELNVKGAKNEDLYLDSEPFDKNT